MARWMRQGRRGCGAGVKASELRKLLGFKTWSGYGETGPLDEEFARPAHELIGALRP